MFHPLIWTRLYCQLVLLFLFVFDFNFLCMGIFHLLIWTRLYCQLVLPFLFVFDCNFLCMGLFHPLIWTCLSCQLVFLFLFDFNFNFLCTGLFHPLICSLRLICTLWRVDWLRSCTSLFADLLLSAEGDRFLTCMSFRVVQLPACVFLFRFPLRFLVGNLLWRYLCC